MEYSVQYYDLVLLGVIASLAVGIVVGVLTPVPLTTAVTVLSLVGVAIVGHGLFVNGPVDEVSDLTEEVDALE